MDAPQRKSMAPGSLTLTVRVGDKLIIQVPGAMPVEVRCIKAEPGRTALNVRAPRAYKVNRVKRDE